MIQRGCRIGCTTYYNEGQESCKATNQESCKKEIREDICEKKNIKKGMSLKAMVHLLQSMTIFFDEKSKMMWSIVCKRKIHYERLIH